MLDGLLNRGFSSKCKSLIKATRTRIEVARRRAEAKQRFLKEDLAKLLANGLDINAYGRTEEFLAGLNLLSCYDFIEQSCNYVLKNLSNMQKQRECPEECREVVASLMFAAARFSDLPELRDMRDLFQERYGSSLECFVNQKFVEILSSRPPITEKRLQLLQHIASEFSIKWDSRGFEQRMTTPSETAQAQANKYGHSDLAADKCLLDGKGSDAKSDKDDVLPKATPVVSNDLRREEPDLHFHGRQERFVNGYKQVSYKGNSTSKDHNDIPVYEREQDRMGQRKRRVKKDVTLSKVEKSGSSPYRKRLESSGVTYPDQDDVKNEIWEKESWKIFSQGKASISPNFAGDKDNVLLKETPVVSNVDHNRMYHGREGDDLRREELDLHFPRRQERIINGYKEASYKGNYTAKDHDGIPFYEREQDRMDKPETWLKKDVSLSKVEKSGSSSYRKRLESSGAAHPDQDDVENEMREKESWKPLSQENASISPKIGGIPGKNEVILFAHEHGGIPRKSDNIRFAHKHGNSQNEANWPKKLQEEEVDGLKSYHNTPRPPPYVKSNSNAIPPPYVKPKDCKQMTSRRSEHAGSYFDEHPVNLPLQNRVNEIDDSDWTQKELDNPVREEQVNGSTRIRSHEKEHCYQDDKIPLPIRRSRRKHHKSSSSHDDVNLQYVEDSGTVKRSSSGRRRDHSRKGLQISMDIEHYRKDDEEKMIDKLLLHYSKKPSTYDDVGKSRKSSQARHSHQGDLSAGESSHDRDTNGYDVKPEIIPPPTRSVSLPHGHSGPSEAKKIFTRANSFQPDNQARHVHPKLPDYDDLAARFAALKGR